MIVTVVVITFFAGSLTGRDGLPVAGADFFFFDAFFAMIYPSENANRTNLYKRRLIFNGFNRTRARGVGQVSSTMRNRNVP